MQHVPLSPSLQLMASGSQQQPLRAYVEQALHDYFNQLAGFSPANLYEMVLAEVEAPLLTVVLQQARGNQAKAAKWLGLSRSTLRKKLQCYHLTVT